MLGSQRKNDSVISEKKTVFVQLPLETVPFQTYKKQMIGNRTSRSRAVFLLTPALYLSDYTVTGELVDLQ